MFDNNIISVLACSSVAVFHIAHFRLLSTVYCSAVAIQCYKTILSILKSFFKDSKYDSLSHINAHHCVTVLMPN